MSGYNVDLKNLKLGTDGTVEGSGSSYEAYTASVNGELQSTDVYSYANKYGGSSSGTNGNTDEFTYEEAQATAEENKDAKDKANEATAESKSHKSKCSKYSKDAQQAVQTMTKTQQQAQTKGQQTFSELSGINSQREAKIQENEQLEAEIAELQAEYAQLTGGGAGGGLASMTLGISNPFGGGAGGGLFGAGGNASGGLFAPGVGFGGATTNFMTPAQAALSGVGGGQNAARIAEIEALLGEKTAKVSSNQSSIAVLTKSYNTKFNSYNNFLIRSTKTANQAKTTAEKNYAGAQKAKEIAGITIAAGNTSIAVGEALAAFWGIGTPFIVAGTAATVAGTATNTVASAAMKDTQGAANSATSTGKSLTNFAKQLKGFKSESA